MLKTRPSKADACCSGCKSVARQLTSEYPQPIFDALDALCAHGLFRRMPRGSHQILVREARALGWVDDIGQRFLFPDAKQSRSRSVNLETAQDMHPAMACCAAARAQGADETWTVRLFTAYQHDTVRWIAKAKR